MSPSPPPIHQWAELVRRSQRINVVGTSGSGKSTFSRELAAVLELPHHEMDAHYWLPGWQGRSDEDFHSRIAGVTAGEAWVLDGNYPRTIPVKWARVECVVWLDYSLPVTFFAQCGASADALQHRLGVFAVGFHPGRHGRFFDVFEVAVGVVHLGAEKGFGHVAHRCHRGAGRC